MPADYRTSTTKADRRTGEAAMRDHIDELIDDVEKNTIKPLKSKVFDGPSIVSDDEMAEFVRRLGQTRHILPTYNPCWDLVIS